MATTSGSSAVLRRVGRCLVVILVRARGSRAGGIADQRRNTILLAGRRASWKSWPADGDFVQVAVGVVDARFSIDAELVRPSVA
jgi:hypothetical protein